MPKHMTTTPLEFFYSHSSTLRSLQQQTWQWLQWSILLTIRPPYHWRINKNIYKIGERTSYAGNMDDGIRKGMGELSTRWYKNRNKSKKIPFCPWLRKYTKNNRWPNVNICQHRCKLPPTKKWPQLCLHYNRYKYSKLPRQTCNKNSPPHHVNDPLEQCPQNRQC